MSDKVIILYLRERVSASLIEIASTTYLNDEKSRIEKPSWLCKFTQLEPLVTTSQQLIITAESIDIVTVRLTELSAQIEY